MNSGVAGAAQRCLESGERAIVVSVLAVRGSAPREAGTYMLVSRAQTFGTIGGGHLEWEVSDLARMLLADSSRQTFPLKKSYALGPSLGQCCGGSVDVEFFSLSVDTLALLQQHDSPLFRLHLFGVGHVGSALVSVMAPLRCQVFWIDEREEAFPSVLPERVRACPSDLPEAEVQEALAGDFFVVMTHRHDLDLRIVEAILRRGDAGFIGLIGSATKRARFASQLAVRGLSMQAVQCPLAPDRVPLALPVAVRKEPGVLALAIAQELLDQSAVLFHKSK
jgi:xanthine dehydrogenase accessory factor